MKISRLLSVAIVMGLACFCRAEDYKLPDAAEITTYSPDAQQFYANGLKALDRVDYVNAYEQCAKAAQLAPSAIRLGVLTAALALKQGRSKAAAEAKPYYETAISAYLNILKNPSVSDALRRDIENRLKITNDERDNLAQRDVRREVMGNHFITDLNRQYVPSTPRPGKPAAVIAVATPAIAPVYTPPGGLQPISPFVQGTPPPNFQGQPQGGLPPLGGAPGGQPAAPINPNNPQPAI